MTEGYGLVIDGQVVAGEAGAYPVRNPVRPAEVVLDAPAASMAQLDQAAEAAHRAQVSWAAHTFDERAALIVDAAQAAAKAAEDEDLATLLTREHGKIHLEAVFDTAAIGGMAAAFAPVAAQAIATDKMGDGPPQTQVQHVPMGVVGALLPFNWPVSVMANKALPALLTGNTVVAKAPPTCPGAVLRATAAMAALLPPGVLNLVNGPEAALGQALVEHPLVDMVSFTGGVLTGQAVMAAAATTTKPVILELGGNDPAILAPDVEVDETLADQLIQAAFLTSGQVCMAIKRLYVPEGRLGELAEALSARLSTEVVGDGLAEEVTMGPVHRGSARDRVESFIEEAEAKGAKVLRPGSVREADASAGGYLVNPALVVDPDPATSIVREEQFAPALPLISYRDLDEVVDTANDTTFGLCASVWSNDEDLCARVADRLEAGTIFVNAHGTTAIDLRAPMGGWKQSGFGLELGAEGMRAFTRPRAVITRPGRGA